MLASPRPRSVPSAPRVVHSWRIDETAVRLRGRLSTRRVEELVAAPTHRRCDGRPLPDGRVSSLVPERDPRG
jgi:hypothetical protein